MCGAHCLFLLILIFNNNFNDCARILCVFTTPSISHQTFYQPIWKELSLRGHQVTVLTPNPLNDDSLKNLREISWHESYLFHEQLMNTIATPPVNKNFFDNLMNVTKITYADQLSKPAVQQLIHNKTEHFDLVIVEWMFPTMFAFSEKFRCPMIGLLSMPTNLPGYDAVGNPSHPVYNPDFASGIGPDPNILERLYSVVFAMWYRVYHNYVIIPEGDAMVEKYFGKNMRSLRDIEKDVSLILLNKNPFIHAIGPNVPALVEINGIHIKENKSLPSDLQNYLDEAESGVIYFSLGSNVKSSSLSFEKLKIIVDALSELPYKVLWKWEKDEMPAKPDNVKISKWIPQQDVLAHPNIKAFITQGGIQSLEEAIYYRIPIVGIPFFGDQLTNIKQMAAKNAAILVDFNSFTKETLKNTIIEIATNPKYKNAVTQMSDILNDKPMKPRDEAIWWIEYVIRHKGAKHLQSYSVHIPWYQYFLFDVIMVLLLTVFILLFTLKFIIKTLYKMYKLKFPRFKIRKIN